MASRGGSPRGGVGGGGDGREKIENSLRYLTHAGETRSPIFA